MAATTIGMSDSEYEKLKKDLSKYESDFISEIDNSVKSIKTLNSKEGGFYAENVTANVNALLSSINKIKKTIKTMHTTEQSVISSFAKVIDTCDKCF